MARFDSTPFGRWLQFPMAGVPLLCCGTMVRKPKIAIVGAGSLGTALATALRIAGYRISEIVSRDQPSSLRRARKLARAVGARPSTLHQADLTADIVWLCVPDRKIASCASALARTMDWHRKLAFHSSGALTSDELKPLRQSGAAVASAHPLMTFVPGVTPTLRGVPFAMEGDPEAVRVAASVVRGLSGESFKIAKRDKPAYHAWGAFTSPLLIAALVTAEQVAGLACIKQTLARRRMLPIIGQSLANYVRKGPAGAFSGPIVRGDTAVIAKHLRILQRLPEAKKVYIALARTAIHNLPTKNRRAIEKLL